MAIVCAIALSACAAFRFTPGESSADPVYFAEAPHLVKTNDTYVLRWRYGSFPYYFLPEYRVIDGDLVFVLRAFTSTGHSTGKVGELEIKKHEAIQALELGRVFWWEPNGSRVQLKIKEEPNQPVQSNAVDAPRNSGAALAILRTPRRV